MKHHNLYPPFDFKFNYRKHRSGKRTNRTKRNDAIYGLSFLITIIFALLSFVGSLEYFRGENTWLSYLIVPIINICAIATIVSIKYGSMEVQYVIQPMTDAEEYDEKKRFFKEAEKHITNYTQTHDLIAKYNVPTDLTYFNGFQITFKPKDKTKNQKNITFFLEYEFWRGHNRRY